MMKFIHFAIIINLITLVNYNSFSQDSIKSDTIITRHIKTFELFSLNFKTCISCGLDWRISSHIDSTNLKIIDSTTTQNSKFRDGGSVTKSWTFQGLTKGDYQLIFIYKRPWLNEIVEKATVNIKIE